MDMDSLFFTQCDWRLYSYFGANFSNICCIFFHKYLSHYNVLHYSCQIVKILSNTQDLCCRLIKINGRKHILMVTIKLNITYTSNLVTTKFYNSS